jgi:hypothetical protein
MGIVSKYRDVYFGHARHRRYSKNIVDNSGVKMDLKYSKHFQSKGIIMKEPSF